MKLQGKSFNFRTLISNTAIIKLIKKKKKLHSTPEKNDDMNVTFSGTRLRCRIDIFQPYHLGRIDCCVYGRRGLLYQFIVKGSKTSRQKREKLSPDFYLTIYKLQTMVAAFFSSNPKLNITIIEVHIFYINIVTQETENVQKCDWLGREVFQTNLENLHVKITVSPVFYSV